MCPTFWGWRQPGTPRVISAFTGLQRSMDSAGEISGTGGTAPPSLGCTTEYPQRRMAGTRDESEESDDYLGIRGYIGRVISFSLTNLVLVTWDLTGNQSFRLFVWTNTDFVSTFILGLLLNLYPFFIICLHLSIHSDHVINTIIYLDISYIWKLLQKITFQMTALWEDWQGHQQRRLVSVSDYRGLGIKKEESR